MEWPLYFREQLKIGNLESEVGIVTLWTKKEHVAKHVPSEKYAAIGQLFSAGEGISILLRNCLANKRIRHLILVGADLTRSGEALLKLASEGIDGEHRIRGVDALGGTRIHKEISPQAIDAFRRHVKLHDLRRLTDFTRLAEFIDRLPRLGAYGQPEVFPEPAVEPPAVYPSSPLGFFDRRRYVGDAWVDALWKVLRFGRPAVGFGGEEFKAILGLFTVVTSEDARDPRWRSYYPVSREALLRYSKSLVEGAQPPGLPFTNGARLRDYHGIDQIRHMADSLRRNLASSRAVACVFNPSLDLASPEPPTLLCIQAFAQTGEDGEVTLHLKADHRSLEVFEEWLLEAYALRALQSHLAEELGWKVGNTAMLCGIAQLYRRNWKKAEEVVAKARRRPEAVGDPHGSFVITLKAGGIEVSHQAPAGAVVEKLYGHAASELCDRIALEGRVSDLSHAMYLGRELQKAELALSHGLRYVQDSDLQL